MRNLLDPAERRSIIAEAVRRIGVAGGAVWGSITGTLSNQSDLQSALNAKETAGAAAAAVAAHEGAADPHTGYQKESEKGAAGGYASLDGGGTVPDAQIPSGIARDSEIVTAIANHEAAGDPHPGYTTAAELSTAISNHEGATNPHPTYLTQAEGDAAYAALAHASRHQNGGADEISVAGLSGQLADAQPVTVRKNTGANVGTRSRLNFIEGANITLTVVDDAGSGEVDVTIAAAAGAADGLGPDGDKGDITVGGGGTTLTIDASAVTATKIADGAVTDAKLTNMAQANFKGRAVAAGVGDPQDLTAADAIAILQTADGPGSGLDADALDGEQGSFYRDASNLNAGAVPAARMPAHTGDVTSTAGSVALTIAANAVSNGKLRQSAGVSLVGRAANSTGDVADITAAANDRVMRRVSNTLDFGQLTADMAPDNLWPYAKLQDVSATSRILGRKTAAAGDIEECTLSEVLDFIGSAAQGDILYRGAAGWARLAAGTAGQVLQTNGAGADPSWVAAGGTWTTVKKPSATQRSSVTILAADPDLLVALSASTWYRVKFYVFLDATNATMDYKYSVDYTGTTASVTSVKRRHAACGAAAGTDNENTVAQAALIGSTAVTATTSGVGYVEIDIILQTNTAGNLRFLWAQNTSDPGQLTVHRGSYLEYTTV